MALAVIGAVLFIGLVIAVIGGLWWLTSQLYPASGARITRFASNPELICASDACSVGLVWQVENLADDQSVTLRLEKPNGDTIPLSSSPSMEDPELRIEANNRDIFSEEGPYRFVLEIVDQGQEAAYVIDSEAREVMFYPGPTFTIDDVWNTGFDGGELSENDTVATRSLLIGQNPDLASSTLANKVPGFITVCSKGMALASVQYTSGQSTTIEGSAGIRELDVTVRRPNAEDNHGEATLAYDETLVLPEPLPVDDGIEIVSVMRSEDDTPIAGAQWGLTYTFDCV